MSWQTMAAFCFSLATIAGPSKMPHGTSVSTAEAEEQVQGQIRHLITEPMARRLSTLCRPASMQSGPATKTAAFGVGSLLPPAPPRQALSHGSLPAVQRVPAVARPEAGLQPGLWCPSCLCLCVSFRKEPEGVDVLSFSTVHA